MIIARVATNRDSKDIFEWRNDELTRKMSFTTDAVEWNEHCKWLSSSIAKDSRLLVLCENVDTPSKVAFIQFDIENNTAVISINISPKERGKGLAKICLSVSISFVKSRFPLVHHIVAQIKTINSASGRAFESVGFILKKETSDIKTYEYAFKE